MCPVLNKCGQFYLNVVNFMSSIFMAFKYGQFYVVKFFMTFKCGEFYKKKNHTFLSRRFIFFKLLERQINFVILPNYQNLQGYDQSFVF